LGAGGRVINSLRSGWTCEASTRHGGIEGGGFDLLKVDAHLLECVEDAARVGELDAVVDDGL
jgi:hypothetical protein